MNLFGYASIENVVKNIKALRQLQNSINIVVSWSNPPPNAAQVVHSLRKHLSDTLKFNVIYIPLPKRA